MGRGVGRLRLPPRSQIAGRAVSVEEPEKSEEVNSLNTVFRGPARQCSIDSHGVLALRDIGTIEACIAEPEVVHDVRESVAIDISAVLRRVIIPSDTYDLGFDARPTEADAVWIHAGRVKALRAQERHGDQVRRKTACHLVDGTEGLDVNLDGKQYIPI